jgi:NAD-dependent dihydropyrimidine dehydrogenase PreA subunit
MRHLAGVTTLRFDPARCTGCERCVEVCPHGVFAMAAGKAALVDRDGCMECGACRTNCASAAIEVRSGVGCAAALLSAAARRGDAPECGCGGG